MKRFIPIIALFALLSVACEEEPIEADTEVPVIESITADKTTINYGGQDPAIITCNATGGSLSYLWEVDLGDIFPLNEDGSQVRFTRSECCLGEKYVKCTVENDKGSVTDTIVITIRDK